PKTATVFDDVSNMIEVAQQRFADLPVYLGGHDSGAGLALNYQSYPQREVVDGLVLLAPDMGPFYDTRRAKGPVFSKIDTSRLLVNLLTAGKAMGTALGSSFAYPAELYMKDSKLISGHTMNMTAAVTPRKPKDQLAELTMPVGVWVGAEDEMIDPAKLTDLVRSAARLRTVATVPAETHFSLQLRAADAIGPWIREQALASK
ncbi:MAG: serine aminopeptidase domain-containing protein, partial [Burkholderiales bacterium]